MAEFRDYALFGDFNKNTACKLHQKIVDIHQRMPTDHNLQALLFNKGYTLEGDGFQSFTSWNDYFGGTFPRKFATIRSRIISKLVQTATEPQVIVIRGILGHIYVTPDGSDEPKISITTRDGYDGDAIEQLQIDWMNNSDITPQVLEYKNHAELARVEFDYQEILKIIQRELTEWSYTWNDSEYMPNINEIRAIHEVFEPGQYRALDNAYYTRGRMLYARTSHLETGLLEDSFGVQFVFTEQQGRQAIQDIYVR